MILMTAHGESETADILRTARGTFCPYESPSLCNSYWMLRGLPDEGRLVKPEPENSRKEDGDSPTPP